MYIIKNFPWMLRFLKNCSYSNVDYIAKSLSNFSYHAESAYSEIFSDINGSIGAITPNSGAFTSLTLNNN